MLFIKHHKIKQGKKHQAMGGKGGCCKGTKFNKIRACRLKHRGNQMDSYIKKIKIMYIWITI